MQRNKTLLRPMPDATLPRNAFDRGFNIKYNFSSGMLLPTFAQYCVGGSNIKINLKSFFRSSAVNTQAMTSVRHFTDFYCVPLRQIYSLWGQFKTRTNDIHSSVYGDLPIQMPYVQYAVFNQVLSDDESTDQLGFSWKDGARRLADLLCYGADAKRVVNTGVIEPLAACAYQKVYFDHYRNTSYEANDVQAYNLDVFAQQADNNITADVLKKILTLRYANYRRDFYGNIYPSLNYISDAANGYQSSWAVPSSVVGVNGNQNERFVNVLDNGTEIELTHLDGYSDFSVQTLRAAFALDKLVRASAYAPQHVKDQYAARYGFKPKGYSSDESFRIGSFMCDINFGEVTSVSDTQVAGSDTQGKQLGAIGGKGVGGSDFGDVISYHCGDDCIIIGVSYVLPRISYDAYMVDRFAQKLDPEDFFQPEFMDLGLQPVFVKDFITTSNVQVNNYIMGYVPRYSEYKINVDKNFGLFKLNRALGIFTMHGRATTEFTNNGLTMRFFKCNPRDMDSIFAEDYDGTEETDQFFGFMEFAFACVAPMSVHGQPRL